MSWLFPTFLAGALAVGIPILLHLLRRQPHVTVIFPSLRFLAPALRKNHNRHRIQRWIVLALRCAALVLLAMAFARPFLGREGGSTSRTVIVVIDHSFSLHAAGRWAAVRDWALEQVGRLDADDKLGLLLAGARPTWLIAPGPDPQSALQTLRELKPGWEAAPVGPALRLAAGTLAATPADERLLIVLTDHHRAAWLGTDFTQTLPAGVPVVFPSPPGDVARQASVHSPVLAADGDTVQATVQLRNFTSASPRTLRVYGAGDTLPLHELTITLEKGESRPVTFTLPPASAGPSTYRFVLDADDLPADDIAYAVWDPRADHTVYLDRLPGGAAGDFVAAALDATASLPPGLRLATPPAAEWPSSGVAVLRHESSFTGEAAMRLDAFLQGGGSALIFTDGSAAQRAWFARQGVSLAPQPRNDEPLRPHNWSMDHPVVAAMTETKVTPLLGWNFRQGWTLPPDAVEPLALWSESAAAIGELRIGSGRVLVCGFTPDRRSGDWPLHPAFVPFIHRAVSYLLGTYATGVAEGARVGGSLALPAESGLWEAIAGPALGAVPLSAGGSLVPSAPGLYAFTHGTDRRIFAVNLSPDESHPATWDSGTPWRDLASSEPAPADPARPQVNLAARDAERHASLWWMVVALAALLLMAEVGLANRTAR